MAGFKGKRPRDIVDGGATTNGGERPHKRARISDEDDEQQQEQEVVVETAARKEKRKKDKKKRQRAEAEVEADESHVDQAQEDEDVSATEVESKKKHRKDKKKLRRAADAGADAAEVDETATATAAADDDDDASSKSKKKHKKDKKSSSSSSNGEQQQHVDSISVHPKSARHTYAALESFNDVRDKPVPGWLIDAACAGFTHPTPIQAYTWRVALAGVDLIGVARTGSGKTLAFTVPGLVQCLAERPKGKRAPERKPTVLVLAPTRELAMQTARVAESCCAASPAGQRLSVACVYGGVDKRPQRAALQDAAMVVATPGRLLDLIDERALELSNVKFFVLDEADRMLDMGFEREVRKIASLVSDDGKRKHLVQTLMFSATWPLAIRKLAAEYLRSGDEVVRVTVGHHHSSADTGDNHDDGGDGDGGDGTSGDGGETHNSHGLRAGGPVASRSVTQHVLVLEEQRQKESELFRLLKEFYGTGKAKSELPRVIVFCLYKKEAARTEQLLQRRGFECVSLHGDMSQADRTRSFEAFRDGHARLLVATDVAARGVDIPDVEHVINYTFPLTIEDYVHRIGRTGRGHSRGNSYTFFTPDDKAHAGELVAVLRQAGQEVPEEMNRFSLVIKKKADPLYGAFGPREDLAGKKSTKITFDSDSE